MLGKLVDAPKRLSEKAVEAMPAIMKKLLLLFFYHILDSWYERSWYLLVVDVVCFLTIMMTLSLPDPLRDLNNIPRKWLMKFSHFSQSWYFVFILPCMLTCNCLLMFWNGRLMVFLCFLHTLFEKTFYQCNCCGFIESNIYHWIDCTIKCSGLTVCIFQYYRSNALYFWSVAIIMRWICLSTSIGKIF